MTPLILLYHEKAEEITNKAREHIEIIRRYLNELEIKDNQSIYGDKK